MVSRRFLITILTLITISLASVVGVFLAKGYTFSPQMGKIVGTGIISVTSLPDGASVYLDDHLTTATNTTISSLTPKTYQVKIIKEGFIPWQKQVVVKEGLVSEVKATLFPAIPTTYPLTFNGVTLAVISDDGQKLAFTVPLSASPSDLKQKGGVWVWNMSSQPIAFARGAEPRQVVSSTQGLDFSKGNLRFSPKSDQILATIKEQDKTGRVVFERNYPLPVDRVVEVGELRDVTATIQTILKGWEEELKAKEEVRLLLIKDLSMRKVASESAYIKWSPDETKVIFKREKETKDKGVKSGEAVMLSGYKVYDTAEDKQFDLPPARLYTWLPDSRHIILVEEKQISTLEFDGENKAVIFAGTFEDNFVFPWPDSSRLAIVSSLPTPTASMPNLFGVNLK